LTATSETRPRSTRLPRHERRRQLLDAALEVFVSQGYHAAAMDEITGSLVDTIRDALGSNLEDPKQRVAATFGAYFEYVGGNGQAYRLVFESDLSNEPAVRDRLEQVQRQCADMVSQAIAEGAGISDDEAHLIGVGLVGMAQVTARYWLSVRDHIPREAAEHLVARLAWRGISGFPRSAH
jgi:AcrR family transcriptional regulator